MRKLNILEKEKLENRFIIKLCGGNNGHPDWADYFKELSDLMEDLINEFGSDNVVIEELTNDVLDDIFYVTLVIFIN